ncbi:hypothetical protein AMAG_16465 [Allomyces macrogynus ATCC 38327]|uniref:G-protein coupled receptors family 3 profile domain-containing protein n=1 Tax=Allomyces macrogynus (strain ATCC 38327) TaxID=578462 RepID=A0A0L0TDF7_ALLM3|nr:hypothetical protein AMAG_16465 [Allomyces macrogynus ATCC 38327]|eukprot:KNE72705.1 hypothetical protein AMAG_16465 [Allomyces macrogynus ATCC 38327]
MSVAPPAMNAIDPNHNYQLLFQDTGGVRVNAMNVFLNVTSQQTVHALVGEYASRVTLGVALAANNRRLWHCGLASSMDFDNKIDFPFYFRPTPVPYRFYLARAGLLQFKVSATFSTSADQLSVSLYSLQQYLPGTTDFTVYLDTILASGSKIILFFGFPSDAKLIMRQAKAKGMVGPDYVWVGTHTMYNYLDNLATESDRRLADGMMFSTLREDHSTSQYQTLRSQYLAQYPSRPESLVSGFALTYYDCLLALAYGFNKMTTLYGDAAVQTHSYPAGVADFLVPFNGTTGSLTFLPTGSRDVRECQIMNIYNNSVRVSYVMTPSGSVDKLADPIFYGGSTTIPVDRPPLAIVHPQWTDAGVQVLSVIRGLMILTMLGGTIFLAINRAEKQIRQLSLPFLLVISLGCILILISEYILIGVPSAPACHTSTVVFTFGYEMVFASAIAKTYRIYCIFDNSRISKGGLKSQDLFRNVAMIMAFQAILFAIWIFAFPVWPTLVTSKTAVWYECRPTNVAGHWAIIGLSFAFNGVMLLFVCYLAYKTRKVDSSYRETHWILYTGQNVFVCSVVIIPLSVVMVESFALTAYYIRAVAMLFAVGFAYIALVGRLVVAVWMDRRLSTGVVPATKLSGTIASVIDAPAQFKLKGASTNELMGRSNPVLGQAAGASIGVPGFEVGGVYPVLRRGGGLGFFEKFTQTWHATQVYMNMPRGIVAISPPPPTAASAAAKKNTGGGSSTARSSVGRKRGSIAAGEETGTVIPLAGLGFDASPAGAPTGCLELVHLGSGAAWVVQMTPEEVVVWSQYLKAVASVITTGTGSSTGGGSAARSGNGLSSGGGGGGAGTASMPASTALGRPPVSPDAARGTGRVQSQRPQLGAGGDLE